MWQPQKEVITVNLLLMYVGFFRSEYLNSKGCLKRINYLNLGNFIWKENFKGVHTSYLFSKKNKLIISCIVENHVPVFSYNRWRKHFCGFELHRHQFKNDKKSSNFHRIQISKILCKKLFHKPKQCIQNESRSRKSRYIYIYFIFCDTWIWLVTHCKN